MAADAGAGHVSPASAIVAPKLELDQAARRFGGIQAVRRLSMRALRGEILGLIGPNGAGKSTVLSLIGGEQAVSAGHIRLDGVRIDRLPHYRRVRAGVAFVRQHAANAYVLSMGSIVMQAPAADLLADERIQHVYLGGGTSPAPEVDAAE
jgi:ABC-type branched-subunit amino acid transport system ATPase component